MISFPKKIQIETSIVCNSHCVFCPHNDMERGPQYMEDRLWKKIIDESRGRGVIYRPFLVNEPFLDMRMPAILTYIRQDPTAKVEFNSNGNFSGQTDIPALLQAGMDWVRFSVDGFTQESFSASGRGGKLDKITENIIRFAQERNRQKSACFIEVRMIDMPSNRHEHDAYKAFWSKHVDQVSIMPLYSWPWSDQESAFAAPCPKIRDEMFFYTDGTAVLCCWDAYGRGKVGNASQNTVEEIWLGNVNQAYRRYLERGERSCIHLCSKCDAFKTYDFSKWQGY